MIIQNTKIDGVKCILPELITDSRGFFYRVFCQNELAVIKPNIVIAQINHNMSKIKGVIRGIHYQNPPHAEMKIAKCIRGSVFYVVVDLRKKSSTFLQWHGEILSADSMKSVLVPQGCAVGGQSLEDNSEIIYMSTAFYCKESEGAIRYDEPKLNIQWPAKITDISEKDAAIAYLSDEFDGVEI
ncbi:dTDP-4-dehydrorhamnose 3,5-epimerase [Spirochaetia bacterium]|nr:dTDP-4-dehydrorhamnose 3,5-epimerase [Spirochaetia bacterium]